MKRLSKALEHRAGRGTSALRLDSIRYKMLFFAVVATIVPSFATAWLSSLQNKSALTTKISGDLVSMSGAVSRELDLWLKGNLYNLRIFTNSYEVTGNVDRDARSPRTNLSRLTDYLRSLQRKFPDDFDELVVVDPEGRTVATSAPTSRSLPLPTDWRAQLRADNSVVGAPLPLDSGPTPTLVIAVPVPVPSGRFVGAFGARLKLGAVARIVKRSVPSPAGATFVTSPEGVLLASSRAGMDRYLRDTVPPRALTTLAAQDSGAVERSEEHTSELQSPCNLVCRLLLEKKKNNTRTYHSGDMRLLPDVARRLELPVGLRGAVWRAGSDDRPLVGMWRCCVRSCCAAVAST